MGLCALAVAMWVGESTGQEARTPGTAVVNFPEGGELRVFVDYVGRTLEVRFVYGDELKGQTIELRPSPEIPSGPGLRVRARPGEQRWRARGLESCFSRGRQRRSLCWLFCTAAAFTLWRPDASPCRRSINA